MMTIGTTMTRVPAPGLGPPGPDHLLPGADPLPQWQRALLPVPVRLQSPSRHQRRVAAALPLHPPRLPLPPPEAPLALPLAPEALPLQPPEAPQESLLPPEGHLVLLLRPEGRRLPPRRRRPRPRGRPRSSDLPRRQPRPPHNRLRQCFPPLLWRAILLTRCFRQWTHHRALLRPLRPRPAPLWAAARWT
jgi:hypothetical protein